MHKTKHQAVDYTPVLKEYIPKMVVLFEKYKAKYPSGSTIETPTSVYNPNGESVMLHIHSDGVSIITESESYGISLRLSDMSPNHFDHESRIARNYMFLTSRSETCLVDIGEWRSVGFVIYGESFSTTEREHVGITNTVNTFYSAERQYNDLESCYFQESLIYECYDYDSIKSDVLTVQELHPLVKDTVYDVDVSSTNLSAEELVQAMKIIDFMMGIV